MEFFRAAIKSPFGFQYIFSKLKIPQDNKNAKYLLYAAIAIGWKVLGGKVRFTNGKIVTFQPIIVYDLFVWAAFGLNYLINALVYIQPNRYDWTLNKSLTPKALSNNSTAISEAEVNVLAKSIVNGEDKCHDEKHVMQLFDSLPPAPVEMLTGNTWKGRIVRSMNVLDFAEFFLVRPLQLLGFRWGKRYCSKHVGDPLLVSWMGRFYSPLPLWGNVAMDEIEYRGVNNATMVYDHQPWQDYFRILDDGSSTPDGKLILLGIWTAREKNGGFFTLSVDQDTPTE